GVPVLAGVAGADRPAVFDDVGEDHDLGMARLLIGAGDVDLERAEPRRKRLQLRRIELLRRKAQHAVTPERFQYSVELASGQRLRQIDALNRGAEDFAGRNDFHQRCLSTAVSLRAKRSNLVLM